MSLNDPAMIAALLRERDSYLRTGREDRAAEVDEQLKLRGHEVEPRKQPPQGRSATPPVETVDVAPKRRPGRPPAKTAE
jgi:hypothetical protein